MLDLKSNSFSKICISFLKLTTVHELKNTVFWDVTPCGSCENRSVRRLLVTANIVPSSPILITLMMEALISSETSFLQEPHGVTFQKTPFFIVYNEHLK
jgi:hypothetical protein